MFKWEPNDATVCWNKSLSTRDKHVTRWLNKFLKMLIFFVHTIYKRDARRALFHFDFLLHPDF